MATQAAYIRHYKKRRMVSGNKLAVIVIYQTQYKELNFLHNLVALTYYNYLLRCIANEQPNCQTAC
jgi:hypothetical protein